MTVNQQIKLRRELSNQKVLTFHEGCIYTGYSESYMYKLTSGNLIPHSKSGKRIFFDRELLDQWLLSNRIATSQELETRASTYLTTTA